MDWKEFIEKKYIDWRSDKRGNAGSQAAYARFLGISPQLLDKWINKGQRPTGEYVAGLSQHFGLEIYEVLGLGNPIENDYRESLISFGLPSEYVDSLLSAREEYTKELSSKGIEIDSPEAREIINKAFVRHGIKFTITSN